jgi:hypothetical protein
MDALKSSLPRITQILLSKYQMVKMPVSDVSIVCFYYFSQLIDRHLLVPANCSTPFWDPIKGQCICTSDTCAFADNSRPIGVSYNH